MLNLKKVLSEVEEKDEVEIVHIFEKVVFFEEKDLLRVFRIF